MVNAVRVRRAFLPHHGARNSVCVSQCVHTSHRARCNRAVLARATAHVTSVLANACGVLGAVCMLLGYGLYFRDQLAMRVTPNASSWSLWLLGEAVTLLIYRDLTPDFAKLAMPVTCLIGSLVVWVVALRDRNFVRPRWYDLIIVTLDLLILARHVFVQDSTVTYVMLLLDTTLTFIPVLLSTRAFPTNESPRTWAIWGIAYFFFALTAVISWEGFASLALPFLYFFLHLGVWALSLSSRLPLNGRLGVPSIISRT